MRNLSRDGTIFQDREGCFSNLNQGTINLDTTFSEKTSAPISEGPGKRFKVAIISEGLGNLGDAYYYTKEALQYAYTNKVFEGAHFFADHPSSFEETNRPERSVGDMYGHYENVMYDVVEGLGTLTADLVLLEGDSSDWIGDQLSHALKFSSKYPNEEYIGISINASGDAELTNIDEVISAAPMKCRDKLQMAKEQGINTIKVTKVINSAISADLVTSAGARGRILQRLESSKQEKIKMSKNKETEAAPAPEAPAPEKHDDEQQDIELIKSMLKKYVGGKSDKEDEGMIRQAAKAYNEMGHPMGEAYEMAAKHFKASKMMKQKEDEAAKKEMEKNPAPAPAAPAPEAPAPEKKTDAPAPEKKDEKPAEKKEEECNDGKKKEEESEKKEDEADEGKKKEAALLGEIAALKNKLAEKEFEGYVESTLAKSGMKREQTSQFRECLEGVKTQKQFDLLFKTFKAGLEGKGSVTFTESNPEKVVVTDKKETLSFADCKN